LTRGWLKASHRALDPARSKPWRPWHPLTRQAQQKVTPGAITEYAIEILATANLFRRGHRICVEIAGADMPTGVAGATNATLSDEFIAEPPVGVFTQPTWYGPSAAAAWFCSRPAATHTRAAAAKTACQGATEACRRRRVSFSR